MKAVFKSVWPYKDDALNLPVASVDAALPYYERVMGFAIVERRDTPVKSAVLERDGIRIGLAENGGDSSQEGCWFEVDSAEAAFAELKANGVGRDDPKFEVAEQGNRTYKQFFLIAPDGLCYCLAERIT